MPRRIAAALTAIILGAALGAGTTALAMDYRLLRIGTADTDGVYYPAGGAICRAINVDRWEHGTRCVALPTKGSLYNLAALRAGEFDIALVQSDVQYQAYKGSGIFDKDGPYRELRSLFSLHAEPFTVVARRDGGIRSVEDLKGKRVGVGPPGSGSRATLDAVIDALGWTIDDFALAAEFPVADQARALCDEQIDAVIAVVGHPNRSIKEMVDMCDAMLIPVKGPAIDRLVAKAPYYWRTSIPGGLYPDNPEAVPTFGLGATVVAPARTDVKDVYAVVKAVFEHFDAFKQAHPAFVGLEKSRMIHDGLTAPLHEGAKRYYRQAGLR